MTIRFDRRSLILLSSISLAACAASGIVVSSHEIDRTYDSTQVGYATRDGRKMPVVISGAPFGSDRAALNGAVIAGMNGNNFGPVFEFAVDPGNPATENSRVLLIFDPGPNRYPSAICRTPPASGDPDPGNVRLAIAYCEGSVARTQANVSAKDVDSPQSPRFHATMDQVAKTLFPPYNPNRNSSGNCTPPC